MQAPPLLSVIIPTCGRPEFLRRCLERLRPEIQRVAPSRYEVIVSDDRPSEMTRSLLTQVDPKIRYTSGPGRGPAANRNHGSSLAGGDWLVFLDDDCIPEPGLLSAYEERIREGGKHLVMEGRISPMGQRTSIDQEAPINETGGYLWSCNFCISRKLFVTIGGFDEAFLGPAMEDVDLRERLLALGESVVFVAQATVLHPWRPRRGFAFATTNAEAHCYFFEKHGRSREITTRWYCERMIRGIARNVLREGHRYAYRGALRYILLEFHSFLIFSIRKQKRKERIPA
jgi:GT2 family glycosyltransferase